MTDRLFIFGPLLGLVLLAPLPFASVLTWAWATIATAVAVLLAAWSARHAVTGLPPPVPFGRVRVPAALFAVAALWIAVQLATWTPAAWHHPIWAEAASVLGTPLAGRITVDPHGTAAGLLRLLTYGAVFWLALQYCRDRKVARVALLAAAVAGTAYAAYGLAVEFTGSQTVLWVKKTAYQQSLTSTFVNKNTYATFAGIGLVCVTAWIASRQLAIGSGRGPGRERIRILWSEWLGRGWPLLLSWIVVATALLMTNSRAGVISTIAGLFAFLISLGLSREVPVRVSWRLAAAVLLAGVFFFWISGDTLTQRLFGTSLEADARFGLYGLTLRAMGDAPLLGMGYGTFDQIFELYRTDEPAFRIRSTKAHSTYLENLMELGIPAAVALFLSIGWLARICFGGVRRRRRDVIYPAVGLGVTVLVAAHSAVDFSLQNPAVAITYAFLMGLACAQSWPSGDLRSGRRRPASGAPATESSR